MFESLGGRGWGLFEFFCIDSKGMVVPAESMGFLIESTNSIMDMQYRGVTHG